MCQNEDLWSKGLIPTQYPQKLLSQHCETLYYTIRTFNYSEEKNKACENIDGKGQNGDDQHLLHVPQCYLLFPEYSVICRYFLFGLV